MGRGDEAIRLEPHQHAGERRASKPVSADLLDQPLVFREPLRHSPSKTVPRKRRHPSASLRRKIRGGYQLALDILFHHALGAVVAVLHEAGEGLQADAARGHAIQHHLAPVGRRSASRGIVPRSSTRKPGQALPAGTAHRPCGRRNGGSWAPSGHGRGQLPGAARPRSTGIDEGPVPAQTRAMT